VVVNQENSEINENASKKHAYNWMMKPTSAHVVNKTSKNYRSMTSLMSRPSAARNLSLHKERHTLGPDSTKGDQTSGMRKNVFQQIQNLTKRDSNSKLKYSSITRRYLGKNH
jgi:response regulator of citrate/malate metabolism